MLVNRVHKPYLCKICGNAAGIKVCKCQKAFYCSKNCQRIDWKKHKSQCYKLVDHPKQHFPNNSFATSNNSSTQLHVEQQQQSLDSPLPLQDEPLHVELLAREGRQYDPTPLQYQQPQPICTNTQSPATTIDDFEENLFNSLMYSVDESTEKEILKSLNTREDELLTPYSLESENYPSVSNQTLRELQVSVSNQTDEPSFNDKIFEQIQRQQSFEYKPETQQLLRETRDNLEKELSLFREINLHEPQQQLDEAEQGTSSSDIMQIPTNPKYVNHARLDEHLLYKTMDDEYGLEEMCSNLIRDMNEYGVCVLDNFIGQEKGLRVLQEVKSMYSAGYFKEGQLVTSKDKTSNKNIRGDKIMWIDGKETGVSNVKFLMNQVDAVITLANRMNDNGKLGQYKIRERTKAMVACYEGKGSHYVKHVDNPNRDGRCITCIYYLNVDWDATESGGLLRIFPDGWADRVADIEPIFDRITFFWSDRRNPHEVQPAHRTRYAITLWYFDANEREQAVRKYQRDCESLRKAA